jgi:hypothetical protein
MGRKESIFFKKLDYLLFSDTLSIIGFLTNLGLITSSYIIISIFKDIFSIEGLSLLWELNIFAITYLILLGTTFKWIIGKDSKFNIGFIIAAICVILITISRYLGIYLK